MATDRTDQHDLRARLVEVGRAAGLDEVGFCSADPFEATRVHIETRRARKLHGGMSFTYRNPARSTDPASALPGARSLVVGARSYARTDPGPPTDGGPHARVAAYAWRDHYADLRTALAAVADELRSDGWRARVLVDDNALVDRAAAHRAGIGWYGKNTSVLVPGRGSRVVLGSVVTDAALAPGRVVDDGCGRCRRCLDACPTDAFIAPGVLDARRCLAWLVQQAGVFPRAYRVALGDRIYGCDDCQDACPINRPANERAVPPEADLEPLVAVAFLLDATDEEILARFGRWYIPGRDVDVIRRNALVVLGNLGDGTDRTHRALVERYASHPDAVLRAHAAWAATRLGWHDVVERLGDDRDPIVLAELAAIASEPGP